MEEEKGSSETDRTRKWGRRRGHQPQKESTGSLSISGGNYRCRFALPLATWLNSFPSSLCPSRCPWGAARGCVCVFVCVEGGKSGSLHNKLEKKEGRGKEGEDEEAGVLRSVCVCVVV